jgi:peptide/nickel transport system permease protein
MGKFADVRMCEWATGNRPIGESIDIPSRVVLAILFIFLPMNSATSLSFQKLHGSVFVKNKGAMFGLVCSSSWQSSLQSLLILLRPDSSPNANRIILEIGGSKPGYSQDFYQVKKEREFASHGFLHQLVTGRQDKYEYVPIVSHERTNDSIIVQKFIDEGIS